MTLTRIFTVESAKTDIECCAPQSIILYIFSFFAWNICRWFWALFTLLEIESHHLDNCKA